MAVLEREINQGGGGDYTTIAAWEAAAPAHGTDIWKGLITDAAEYTESVQLVTTGTASLTSHYWLTVDPAVRHSGVAGTGHARMRSTAGHVLTISSSFTRIEGLEINQDGTGASDEGIRVTAGTDDVVISDCIIWTDQAIADQDGIYLGNWSVSNLRIDNTIIYGFYRAGINLQQYDAATPRTQTAQLDHVTVYDCGVAAEDAEGGIVMWSNNAGDNITITAYNTIAAGGDGQAWANYGGAGPAPTIGTAVGTVTWNGSHNLKDYSGTSAMSGSTNNITNWQEATDGIVDVSQASGSYVVFEDLTPATLSLLLLDAAAGNLAARNGVNRQGSEPDSRQDFSTDIEGEARPTSGVDIGADQFVTSGVSIAVTAATETEASQAVTVTTTDPAFPLDAPANLTATVVSPTRIDLSWDAVTNAIGYRISKNGSVIVEEQAGLTYSDTSVTPGSTNIYEVRPIKGGA